jgi:hypothetical protein
VRATVVSSRSSKVPRSRWRTAPLRSTTPSTWYWVTPVKPVFRNSSSYTRVTDRVARRRFAQKHGLDNGLLVEAVVEPESFFI